MSPGSSTHRPRRNLRGQGRLAAGYNAVKANEQVSQATRDHNAALLQLERDMQGFEKIQAAFSGTITERYLDVGALDAVGSATDMQKQDSRESGLATVISVTNWCRGRGLAEPF